jgi:hypothetical protein
MVFPARIITGSVGQLSVWAAVYNEVCWTRMVASPFEQGKGRVRVCLWTGLSANAGPRTLVLSPFSKGRGVSFCSGSPATDSQRTLPLLHRGSYFGGQIPNSSLMNSLVPGRPVRRSHSGPPSLSKRRSISKNGQHNRSWNAHSVNS